MSPLEEMRLAVEDGNECDCNICTIIKVLVPVLEANATDEEQERFIQFLAWSKKINEAGLALQELVKAMLNSAENGGTFSIDGQGTYKIVRTTQDQTSDLLSSRPSLGDED